MSDQQYEITSINMRLATDDDQHLPGYDHTRLSNINQCPTWGAIRYGLHLRMPGAGRSMALEAGAAAHEGFAALRLFQLYKQTQNQRLINFHGHRLFGEDRFGEIWDTVSDNATDTTNLINVGTSAINNSGFYDDPNDRNRTLSNIETSLIYRCQQTDLTRNPIWIRDDADDSDVGVEIGFDVVVEIKYLFDGHEHTLERRFIGKLDGLQYNKQGKLMVCEDKTGARLDDSWLAQWILSHQITGYCLAGATFTDEECHRAKVLGMKIPMARDISGTVREEVVNRHSGMYTKWAEWFVHSVLLFENSVGDVLRAPMYTHSCNRYFNSCAFLPLCAAPDDEEKQQVLADMEKDEWNPLHE